MKDATTTNEHERLISKKVVFYKNCEVHITRKDGTWENGIINKVGADYLILTLSEKGKAKHKVDSIPIFFLELSDIEEFKSPKVIE